MSHIDSTWMDGATGAERLCVISWTCPPRLPPRHRRRDCAALCVACRSPDTLCGAGTTLGLPHPHPPLCARLSEVKSEGSDPSHLRLRNSP